MKIRNAICINAFALIFSSLCMHGVVNAQTSPNPEKESVEISDEDMALFDSLFEEENRLLDESIRKSDESIRKSDESIRNSREHSYFLKISTERSLWVAADMLECHSNPEITGCIDADTKMNLDKLEIELEEISGIYELEGVQPLTLEQNKRKLDLITNISKTLQTFGADKFATEKPESLIELMR